MFRLPVLSLKADCLKNLLFSDRQVGWQVVCKPPRTHCIIHLVALPAGKVFDEIKFTFYNLGFSIGQTLILAAFSFVGSFAFWGCCGPEYCM